MFNNNTFGDNFQDIRTDLNKIVNTNIYTYIKIILFQRKIEFYKI